MLNELVKVANKLDSVGLTKEADLIDAVITNHIKTALAWPWSKKKTEVSQQPPQPKTIMKPNAIYLCNTSDNTYKTAPTFMIAPAGPDATQYWVISKCAHQYGKDHHAFDIFPQTTVNRPFSEHINHNDEEISPENTIKALNIANGYYVLIEGDGKEVYKNKHYFFDGTNIKEITLAQNANPIMTYVKPYDFLTQNLAKGAYQFLPEADYNLIVAQTGGGAKTRPAPTTTALKGDALWNDNDVKALWISRSTKLKKLTTLDNFRLWLKRRNLSQATKEQITQSLNKDIKEKK